MDSNHVRKRVSPASARSHTRKSNRNSNFSYFSTGMIGKITVVLLMGILAWAYQVVRPPPAKICGTPSGPPITAPRIKLRDGRYLAYKEHGVPNDTAKYFVIHVHGTGGCRHDPIIPSPEFVEKSRVYYVSIDRPGYGESDPDPERTPKSLALDIEELADQLKFESKFYVMGHSMGGQAIWGCLKYIHHRLAGAALVTPVINYWWPGFPANMCKEAYALQPQQDQWALRIAHYTPWLTYWWNSQKWFPSSSVLAQSPNIFSRHDLELLPKLAVGQQRRIQSKQQGDFESVHRDMIVGFGTWEFDPMDLENPFPDNEGSVHIWQGEEDKLVPRLLQRYITEKLPWIHYHEVPGVGHMFPFDDGVGKTILKSLLFGQE